MYTRRPDGPLPLADVAVPLHCKPCCMHSRWCMCDQLWSDSLFLDQTRTGMTGICLTANLAQHNSARPKLGAWTPAQRRSLTGVHFTDCPGTPTSSIHTDTGCNYEPTEILYDAKPLPNRPKHSCPRLHASLAGRKQWMHSQHTLKNGMNRQFVISLHASSLDREATTLRSLT